MRRLALLLAVFALGLVIACGGGDDDNGDGDNGGNGGDQPSAGSDSGGNGGGGGDNNDDGDNDNDNGGNGGGGDSDFCSPDDFDAIFDSIDFTNLDPDSLQTQFDQVKDALSFWEDNAPNDIEDDVSTVVSALRGFIELLEENDFNFFAMTGAQNDPRFLALDSPEFNEAADRVSDYCGFDFDSPVGGGGGVPGFGGGSGGSSGGSSGGGFSVDLPDDFPSDLVPPDSNVGSVVSIGIGTTVEFMSDASTDQVQDFYEDALGAPTFSDADGVTWAGGTQTVTISGSDGNVTILVILLSS